MALLHVGSAQIRDLTHVPFIGRQILNHWTTREVRKFPSYLSPSQVSPFGIKSMPQVIMS